MTEYAGGAQQRAARAYRRNLWYASTTGIAALLICLSDGHAGDAALRLSRGIPIGKAPIVDIRNAHASYVVTW